MRNTKDAHSNETRMRHRAEPHTLAPSLQDIAKQIRKIGEDADVGPLRMAEKMVAIEEHWEACGYRAQSGGKDCQGWANEEFGNQKFMQRMRRRNQAILILTALGFNRDRIVLCEFHHDVAVYLTGETIPASKLLACIEKLRAEQKACNGALFNRKRAERVISNFLGRITPLKRTGNETIRIALKHIAVLEATIRALGEDPPELPQALREAARQQGVSSSRSQGHEDAIN